MDTVEQRDKIIEQLEILNEEISRQNTIRHVFGMGIIYGIGFFVGSAIIATVALGIFGPWVAKIDWVRDNFERGASLID